MVSVLMSPSIDRRGYTDIPQHPLERLYPLRVDVELRRNTFSQWPMGAAVSPGRLCDNGFYYMGIQDKVQCTFCGGILSGWSKDDDVFREHAKHFGQCELVRVRQKKACARKFEFSIPSNQSSEQRSSVSNARPYNTQYSLYRDRLSSFQNWPRGLKQSVEDLAATGLYYKGSGDKCQCYMCGGILSGWETGDIPKDEHKKWFPKCPLV